MVDLTLAPTTIATSRLGFGCVKLTAHRNRREAVSMLEHVFSLGIKHFDVARAYGFGRAEAILGEFLKDKRHQVTVTTKLGLQPPSGLAANRWLIEGLKKVLSPFPALLQRAKKRGSALTSSGVFAPEAAVRSIELSLRELGTDYVDILLLHEATLSDAANSALLETLWRQVALGKVRALGIGSDFDNLHPGINSLPAEYQVLQFENNAFRRNTFKISDTKPRAFITHSIFQPADSLGALIKLLPAVTRQFSSRLDADLSDPEVLRSWLLKCALSTNPRGIVLFASTNPQHAANNIRACNAGSAESEGCSIFSNFVDEVLRLAGDPFTAGVQRGLAS
ncbi:MAG TPA: aldo/keto reductase [Terriglobales bacterium]|nr:aldo/keto reductase [Terriglobales bacterium]